jgi:hypothetical protein
MQQGHPIDVLCNKLKDIAPYPEGVVPVPTCIKATAFFPGGTGLWDTQPHRPLPPMPMGKVMILGQDFSSEVDYYHYHAHAHSGENLKTPTWRNLLWLLAQVHVPAHACFFTNMYMGLRAGNAKLTGRFPGARSPHFVHQCQTFLAAQIAAQRPRLILTLGVQVPAIIAPLSADLAGWAHCNRFRALDLHGPPSRSTDDTRRPFSRAGQRHSDRRRIDAPLPLASVRRGKAVRGTPGQRSRVADVARRHNVLWPLGGCTTSQRPGYPQAGVREWGTEPVQMVGA